MNANNQSRIVVIALLIIGSGILLLFNSLGLLPAVISEIFISWQMLLIVIGFIMLLTSEEKIAGTVMVAIGGIFLLAKFYDFKVSVWNIIWPTILILIGIMLLTRHLRKRKEQRTQPEPQWSGTDQNGQKVDLPDVINEVAIFGGNEKMIFSRNLKGGKITNIFGGSELNFSKSELADGINTLEVLCIFGGSTMVIPSHWDVKIDVISIFGGFTDKRFKNPEPIPERTKTLYIKGLVIFGGGELKSYP